MNTTKSNTTTNYLTPSQLGSELNITGRTVLYWESRGIIHASIRIGKIVRFNLADVRAQLLAATNSATLKELSLLGESNCATATKVTGKSSCDHTHHDA